MHIYTEPSLTLATLSRVLDDVYYLDDVGSWLQIPDSKRDELNHQYDRTQLPRAYSTVFLTENPSPSWSTVALALWQIPGELGALEVVQEFYPSGASVQQPQLTFSASISADRRLTFSGSVELPTGNCG